VTVTRRTVLVAGALAQRPGIGGHAWVFLNWIHGLRSLGFDVLFLDRLEPEMIADPAHPECSRQWRWLHRTMTTHQITDFALLYDRGRACLGLERAEALRRASRAELLFNVMGYLNDEELCTAVERRVFVDIDPGFPQLWCAQQMHDAFVGHDAFVTVGLGVGQPECSIPTAGHNWITTVPPVAIEHWPATELPEQQRVTSVCTWRGPFAPIEHEGERYGLRVHEFRQYLALPRAVPEARFELALDIDPADATDRDGLTANGWLLADPSHVAATPTSYQRYIQGSTVELQVAKEMYVRTRSGWFSDRSAGYLACGRPVVAHDTGAARHLPTGEGLLTFSDPASAVDAIEEVLASPARHAKAARELAMEHFDARRVLGTLIDQVSS
jgi:hypothetical protein